MLVVVALVSVVPVVLVAVELVVVLPSGHWQSDWQGRNAPPGLPGSGQDSLGGSQSSPGSTMPLPHTGPPRVVVVVAVVTVVLVDPGIVVVVVVVGASQTQQLRRSVAVPPSSSHAPTDRSTSQRVPVTQSRKLLHCCEEFPTHRPVRRLQMP
jgi:hypothetical protein